MERKKIYRYICLILKYLFAMLFPVLAVVMHKMNGRYIAAAAAEVLLIAFFTNLLCFVKNWLGYLFNTLALLLMNAQFAVLYWGSTFVSAVMLANLDSINAISGKFFAYSITVVTVLVFSCLPVCPVPGKKKTIFAVGGAAAIVYVGIISAGITAYSPYRALYMLYRQMEQSRMAEHAVNEAVSSMKDSAGNDSGQQAVNEFYAEEVSDYRKKPENMPENPNVILVFVEGMSRNIMEDPRNIMPNLSAFEERSISFTNYYNHTFATYMGLSGQLYSDYQRDLYDANPFVSLQDIFKSYGYETVFIDTEPENEEFREYLTNFGFDELLADKSRMDGMAGSISDKTAYEMLFETALEKNKEEAPFFLAMYSFGTHVSLDGVYEKFESEPNALLNKFYDLDVQIGTFLERFQDSELAENTVIVLTSDHATYQDADFVTVFPDYRRENPSLDRIPFLIFYQGVAPEKYDVNGRNSLDMAPTLLDLLDMSAPNYFLGDSLFGAESKSPYDIYYESMGEYYCTGEGEIRFLSTEEMKEFEGQLAKYYALKLSDQMSYEEFEQEEHIYAKVKEDRSAIEAELENADAWDEFHFAVWSEEGEQDDLQWFHVRGNHKSSFTCELDLSGYDRKGVYYVHVYGSMKDEDELTVLGETKVYVD